MSARRLHHTHVIRHHDTRLSSTRPEAEGWRAEVERIGRWTWRITISNGFLQYGPDGHSDYRIGTRRRADAAARRLLARARRHFAFDRDSHTIR